jgi:lipopolysaccharide/colanic/teichoic acid biosynthesis glycosyltransferase
VIKRLFDIFVSTVVLIFASPLLIAISIWVKLDSRGPVFYRGLRSGLKGAEFQIFKFRSMVVDADKSGVSSTSSDDSRITASGHFIRKWKLDELAQLLNVFVGDMSLVGPRPEVKEFTDMFTREEEKILSFRPGITDWASIWNSDEGGILADAIDADAVYLEVIRPVKLELQLFYVSNQTLFSDIKILIYTIYRVFNSSFNPQELRSYPDFAPLRTLALAVIQKQKEMDQLQS